MTPDAFLSSLDADTPPRDLKAELAALWWARKGDWHRAHEIVQRLPGREAARVHAWLHRVEGDRWNSEYWHRRAGTAFPEHLDVEDEWRALVTALLEERPLP
ncbi:MAG: hypothetical protein D6717_02160 [Gammaproteobacteria bacterium]|nr:MAG: hypothetical protein D6717_02160 [Gammaproteobacteria bacterium]